jgi:hypothetical protein
MRTAINYQQSPIGHPVLSHTKDCLLLSILKFGAGPKHSPKVVIVDLLLVCLNEVPPPFFPCFALHLIFIYGGSGIEVGEFFLEVFVDIIVDFSEPECRAAHLFKDFPVGQHVLNSCRS